ncbi:MAG TPA: SsrA-binding protein SmpB [Candidatus Peribacterales bacterium]|nr:SsrA-binding protein SmpB [Candidatus Peribacterales bacterium]
MKVVAKNKRVRFDYEILEELEAGMILTGQEVKSVRAGNADLKGAYVSFLGSKPILKNSTIQPYKYASNLTGYDPGRDRELLLRKGELEKLRAASEEKGISVLPLEFRSGRMIKVLLGVGRGRKTIDKRRRIKEREVEKKIRKGEEW